MGQQPSSHDVVIVLKARWMMILWHVLVYVYVVVVVAVLWQIIFAFLLLVQQ